MALHVCDTAGAGVAKAGCDTDGSMAGTTVGTPHYLSPEMCDGKRYGKKTDVWALGCILYEIVCQRKAFEASNIGGKPPQDSKACSHQSSSPLPRGAMRTQLQCSAFRGAARFGPRLGGCPEQFAPTAGMSKQLGSTQWPCLSALMHGAHLMDPTIQAVLCFNTL